MKAMVDYIYSVTGKVIAMNEDKYVYLSTNELVEEENIVKANELKLEEELKETQAQFRAERDKLLVEADIEINKLVDAGIDSTEWRVYRQELRDSTLTWVLPSKPTGGN